VLPLKRPTTAAKAAAPPVQEDRSQRKLRRSIERQVKREMLDKQKQTLAEEQAKLEQKEAEIAKRQEDIKKQKEVSIFSWRVLSVSKSPSTLVQHRVFACVESAGS